MKSYRSLDSPSVQKMNTMGADYASQGVRPRRGVQAGHIFGDPFALSTTSIALIAWIIALVGSIISTVMPAASLSDKFPGPLIWWTLAYTFLVIVGVIVAILTHNSTTYHVAIVGFLAALLIYTSSAVNSLVYSRAAANQAAAAGFILLSILSIVWIFYFGSQPQARHRSYIDSFALNSGEKLGHGSRTMSHMNGDHYRPETLQSNQRAPQMYTSSQLNGFETSSPVTGYHGGNNITNTRESVQPKFGNAANVTTPPSHTPIPGATHQSGTVHDADGTEVTAPTEYPYRAKAIYSYEANPDDVNEISFSKHEVLDVSDVSGRWWQARKETGQTGIAPSNYLILL